MKGIGYINQWDVYRATEWPKQYKQGIVSSTIYPLALIPTLSLSQEEEDASQW